MTRSELNDLIESVYSTSPEFLWQKYPATAVYRHGISKKWFALATEIPREKLGIPESGSLEIVNFKCDPVMIGSLLGEPGFFPAYHMSKSSWITVSLGGEVPDDTIRFLLDLSYELTGHKAKKQ